MRRPPAIVLAVLVGLALTAAALISRAAGAASQSPSVVRVVERDFHITAVHGRIKAGPVTFRVANRGPDEHEFIVVRVGPQGGLPMRPDGITLDEDALEKNIVDAIEPSPAGHTDVLRVSLKRGRYALVCNMFGHFMGGMYAPLVVQ